MESGRVRNDGIHSPLVRGNDLDDLNNRFAFAVVADGNFLMGRTVRASWAFSWMVAETRGVSGLNNVIRGWRRRPRWGDAR